MFSDVSVLLFTEERGYPNRMTNSPSFTAPLPPVGSGVWFEWSGVGYPDWVTYPLSPSGQLWSTMVMMGPVAAIASVILFADY